MNVCTSSDVLARLVLSAENPTPALTNTVHTQVAVVRHSFHG